jgi:lipoprotein NlpD
MRQRRAAPAAAAPVRAAARLATLALGALLLVGCSARWGAPLESREGGRTITGPTYKVKAGDTLQVIGWQAGIDYRRLADWNGLRSADRIYVGQVLRLTPPEAGGTTEPARGRASPSPAAPAPEPATGPPQRPRDPATATPSHPRAVAASATPADGAPRLQWPTAGRVVQTFAANDPGRKGVKIRGRLGQPIVAAQSGQVVYSGSGLVGYGPLIIVQHDNNYLSAYGHNRKLLVQQGDRVAKGAKIAEMGLAAGEPLLHFEVRRDGEPVDPVALLPRR